VVAVQVAPEFYQRFLHSVIEVRRISQHAAAHGVHNRHAGGQEGVDGVPVTGLS